VAHYVDTSALLKLVVDEAETPALLSWLDNDGITPVSSDLTRTELMRAVRRAAPDEMTTARRVLDGLILINLTTAIYDAAGRLDPDDLCSLDAIHVAAALHLGDDLEGLVTYDDRLAAAAKVSGVPVVAPR
jgi:predicted nucleic acid-binding protein